MLSVSPELIGLILCDQHISLGRFLPDLYGQLLLSVA